MAASLFDKAKGFLGRREAQPTPGPARKPIVSHHAVGIAPGHHCCSAARGLEGQRFLSREAPPLPLKGCGRDECTCRYVHYDDRRKGPRRARDQGVSVDGYIEEERRDRPGRGRRKVDR